MALPAEAFSPLLNESNPEQVTISRTHFSDRRPVLFELCVRGQTGWTQKLFAECVGSDAYGYAEAEKISLNKSRRAQLQNDSSVSILTLSDYGLVVRKPGFDTKLSGLRLLHNPHEVADLISRLEGRSTGPVHVELVAHRLGKRAVLKVTLASRAVRYIRLRNAASVAGRECFELHQILHRKLRTSSELRLPRPVGFDDDTGAAVYDTLAGVAPSLSGDTGVVACRKISRAVFTLQRMSGVSLKTHTRLDEVRILKDFFMRLRAVFPAIADDIAELYDRVLTGLRAQSNQTLVPCHRDFHQRQLLLSGESVGLLDFDTVCQSDSALDIGNLRAHLVLSGLRGECQPAAMEQALADGHPAVSAGNAALWRSCALLRLAMIYAFTSESRSVIYALIKEATTWRFK